MNARFRVRLARSWGRAAVRLARTGLLPGSTPPRRIPSEQAPTWAASYARSAVQQARLALAARPAGGAA